MPKNVLVQQFMSAQPITVRHDELLERVQDLMRKNSIRHLPVLREAQLYGLISDRDVKMALALRGADPKKMTAGDIASTDVYTTHPESPLARVASEMADKHYGSCVVTNKNEVVGILTSVDLARALSAVINGELFKSA